MTDRKVDDIRGEYRRFRARYALGCATLLSLLSGFGGRGSDLAPAPPAPVIHTYPWSQMTPRAAFAGRDGAGLLAFNSRLWLLGGWRWPSNGLPADWNGYETTSEVCSRDPKGFGDSNPKAGSVRLRKQP